MKLIASGVTLVGRHRQIAFVLAILVVDDDDHLAGGDGGDCASRRVAKGDERRATGRQDEVWRRHDGWRSSESRDVFAEHIGFEIDGVARARLAKRRVRERERHDLHADRPALERRDRQADAVDGDRTLRDRRTARARRARRPRASSRRRPDQAVGSTDV